MKEEIRKKTLKNILIRLRVPLKDPNTSKDPRKIINNFSKNNHKSLKVWGFGVLGIAINRSMAFENNVVTSQSSRLLLKFFILCKGL